MKTRTLKDNRQVEELDHPIILEIKTKCPEKWTLVDNETGEVYTGTNAIEKYQQWKRIDNA
jgi:hypothetical protein